MLDKLLPLSTIKNLYIYSHVTVLLTSDEEDCGSRIEIRNSPTTLITENLKEIRG